MPGLPTQVRKNGKFSTSKAALKRKALGLDKPKPSEHIETARRAAVLAALNPELSPEERHGVSNAITIAHRVGPGLVDKQILKVQQALRAGQALWAICNAMPKAAKYLVQLVGGTGRARTAPHSVRLQAAIVVLEMGGAAGNASAGSGEMAEMSKDELIKAIQGINLAIASRSAEDAEVVAQPAADPGVDLSQLA